MQSFEDVLIRLLIDCISGSRDVLPLKGHTRSALMTAVRLLTIEILRG